MALASGFPHVRPGHKNCLTLFMQTASFSVAQSSYGQVSWLPPAWHTVILATDAEDTIWGAAGLIGMQTRRRAPVTILSIVTPDKQGRYPDAALERRADLRQAACHLEFGSTVNILPLNLPDKSRLQQQVTLLSEIWPTIAGNTLLVAPRLNAMANQAARMVCNTALSQLNIVLATYPPAHVIPFEQPSITTDDARLVMDAELWEAKRDALRCFSSENHPVVDGPFALSRTGRFARLHEDFSLTFRA
jgi:hypothetical protein